MTPKTVFHLKTQTFQGSHKHAAFGVIGILETGKMVISLSKWSKMKKTEGTLFSQTFKGEKHKILLHF